MTHKRILLIGAGEAGVELIHDVQQRVEQASRILCVIDDDPRKWGTSIGGVPVVGGRDAIRDSVREYGITDIILAIPSADTRDKQAILSICQETACALKILPPLFQLVDPVANIKLVRNVEIADLLGREEARIDLGSVSALVRGQCVLVTGGGGSIGSELCRQLAACGPARLIVYEGYENNAYLIQQELLAREPACPIEIYMGSVQDTARLEQVFAKERPALVYHAAAHKHVPLMEHDPREAVKNNVVGTCNVIRACQRHGVRRFVLISTDKAVNPSSVMGMTKRVCERIVQAQRATQGTSCSAVRFGNVLGSNGSVVPLFRRQIEYGGPITITHPDVSRYFMTISEAASLVLASSAIAGNGELFILDMGEPIRIVDMARNLIRLCGLEPDRDIEIRFTGLRPGEKLHESLTFADEPLQQTPVEKIYRADVPPFETAAFLAALTSLVDGIEDEALDVRGRLRALASI